MRVWRGRPRPADFRKAHTIIHAVILRKRRSFAKRRTCRRRIYALGLQRQGHKRSLQAATAAVLCSQRIASSICRALRPYSKARSSMDSRALNLEATTAVDYPRCLRAIVVVITIESRVGLIVTPASGKLCSVSNARHSWCASSASCGRLERSCPIRQPRTTKTISSAFAISAAT